MNEKQRIRKKLTRRKRVKKKLAVRRRRLRAERQMKELENARSQEIDKQAAKLHALIPPETIEIPLSNVNTPVTGILGINDQMKEQLQ